MERRLAGLSGTVSGTYATFALFGNVPAEDLDGGLGDGIAATLRAHPPSGTQRIRALPC